MEEFVKYQNRLSFKNKLSRFLWNVTWSILFKPLALPFFNKFRINLLRLFGAKIGNNCKISSSFKVWAPWNLEMGDFVGIGFDAFCYNPGKITINSKCTISQRAHLCSASHDITLKSNPLIVAPITIHNRAWIAADAFVGMGVTVGEGAVVGARGCVFKNVEPWTIVGGNPAKFLKKREING